jgi:dynein heavy chain, axonemal
MHVLTTHTHPITTPPHPTTSHHLLPTPTPTTIQKTQEELLRLRKHYNHFLFQALLHCAKTSMDALKKRIAPRGLLQNPITCVLAPVYAKQTENQHQHHQPHHSWGQQQHSPPQAPPSVQPFFEVNVHLTAPSVVLQPSLDEIQACINQSAQAILRCFTKAS